MSLFLKALVRDVVRRAAQDPRVREGARKVFENEIKPRAKTAWEKAKPEVEAALEQARPHVEAAKKEAIARATDLGSQVKSRLRQAEAERRRAANAQRDQRGSK